MRAEIFVAFCALLAAEGCVVPFVSAAEGGGRVSQQLDAKIKECGYPAGTRGDEIGTAVVHVWIDEKGLPSKVSITSTSGFPSLDAAALDCARKSTWPPAESQGKPVAAETDARFEWTGTALPATCARPLRRNSLFTITIRLTPAAAAAVVFDRHKPGTPLAAGVIGQSVICACVDAAGRIKDAVELVEESGSSLLDAHAVEIGKSMMYPTGHAGCMRNAVNFKGPGE